MLSMIVKRYPLKHAAAIKFEVVPFAVSCTFPYLPKDRYGSRS